MRDNKSNIYYEREKTFLTENFFGINFKEHSLPKEEYFNNKTEKLKVEVNKAGKYKVIL